MNNNSLKLIDNNDYISSFEIETAIFSLEKLIYTYITEQELRATISNYYDISKINGCKLPREGERTELQQKEYTTITAYNDILISLIDINTMLYNDNGYVAQEILINNLQHKLPREYQAILVALFKKHSATNETLTEQDIYNMFSCTAEDGKPYTYTKQNKDGSFVIKVDELALTFQLSKTYKYVRGQFYTVDGLVSNEIVQRKIYNLLAPYSNTAINGQVKNVFESLKMCDINPNAITVKENEINVKNGTLYADDKNNNKFTLFFKNDKHHCFNRIPTAYNSEAPEPKAFLKFLNELIPEKAQRTVQQYLGYCLIPTTKLQTTLVFVGDGGEGKSVLGEIMLHIFGEQNALKTSIVNFDTNRFALANLENKLICVDDDATEHALKNSSNFKTMVTNNGLAQAERKFQDPENIQLYARFIFCSNFAITAEDDTSDAFYRRFKNIYVLPKPKNRQDNKNLINELKAESTSILKWLVDGLNDLIENDFELYVDKEIQAESERIQKESDTVALWLDEDNNLLFGNQYAEHTSILYEHYELWCDKNAVKPVTKPYFSRKLSQKAKKYNLTQSNNVKSNVLLKQSLRRGYKGIGIDRTQIDITDKD